MKYSFHLFTEIFAIFFAFACTPSDVEVLVENESYYPVEEVEIISDEDGWDLPANEGIRNALLNAEQLVNIRYKVAADFNRVGGHFDKGTTVKGIVYSSTRAEDLLVPNNVSLWTFMSALKSPNSYPYTVDITQSPYFIQGSAKPFYGLVCTSLVQYALGIKYNFQIHQMTVWDGIDKVMPQDIERLRLGDIFTTERGHTILVTGIRRENGHIVEIMISEGRTPCAKLKTYSVEDVLKMIADEGYAFYRYRYINNTSHTPSPFVAVGDEDPVTIDVLSDMVVIPRRGDKANWRKDEAVVLDVISRGDYTHYVLFKDGVEIGRKSIPVDNVINFGVMPFGTYSLYLTGENGNSRETNWIVADYAISARALGESKVLIHYSSRNAKASWLTWRRPAKENSDKNNMPLWTTVIDGTYGSEGDVVTKLNPYIKKKYGLGEWDFKVAFETEYGIIDSDSENIYVR